MRGPARGENRGQGAPAAEQGPPIPAGRAERAKGKPGTTEPGPKGPRAAARAGGGLPGPERRAASGPARRDGPRERPPLGGQAATAAAPQRSAGQPGREGGPGGPGGAGPAAAPREPTRRPRGAGPQPRMATA